ncbi:uncharacterized protein LOC124127371 [Haliotis rufescens]|uniref:uncharacterized protein LOC124127371 n=1 Tax=Haliotis rufescens TaxID=6454 RepID=UPI00201FA9CC|nr:uncharacterized protein LOC124127371 [Haliotis rufescens]XP_048240632.1 uncharacterized protein LOC124127371 [Haliotis rufescens]
MGHKPTKPMPDKNPDGQLFISPKYSAHHMELLHKSLAQLLVFSSTPRETAIGRAFRRVIKQVIPQMFQVGEDILMKGDECSGIYFIMEGTVAVVTEDGMDIIATLTSGQFFGEVSTLYKLPVTARVRAESLCECLVLEEDHVRELLPNSSKVVDIINWFVAKKYIPTSSHVDSARIYRRTLLVSLQELPLFEGWSEVSLKNLVLSVSDDSVVLYPQSSFITCVGDPPNILHILLRGRAVISGKSGVCVETTAEKYPIVIGETGLFVKKASMLNVMTVTQCQVVSVSLEHLTACLEQGATGCREFWERRTKLWENFVHHRENLTDIHQDVLQYEVTFQFLSNSSLFKNTTLPLLQHLVMESHVLGVTDGVMAYSQHDSKQRTILLVLEGRLEVTELAASPLQTAGSPSQTAGSPSQTAGSPSQTAGSPSQTAGAPSQTAGSPSQTAGSPSQTAGATTLVAGSSQRTGSPSPTTGSSSQRAGSSSPPVGVKRTVTQGQIIAKVPGVSTMVTYKSVGKSSVIKFSTPVLKQALMKFAATKGKS